MAEREIFAAAAQIESPSERVAYLDQACGGDAALRQRIGDLLAEQDKLGSFLEVPPAAAATIERSPAISERLGTQIGPYKLLQKLGEGGMGSVFLAEQQQPVKRQVALKIIKAGMDSAQVIARFEQERQALAIMDHPHIAKVLDAGTTDSGRPYFVMELVKGIPITRYCDQEHLSPKERLELFIPVCQAVQHAHQKGIIHRDLKPSNVLIALYDGRPVPKVIDFGVAKATSQKLTERTLFTEVGSIVGTLEYMAPEQAELNNLDIDTRADIYSLGVLLYELLTGAPPFSSQQLRAAGFNEMMRIIKEVEPQKPSTRLSSSAELPSIAANRKLEPRRLTRLVQGDLDWIVMKCLEKERNRRYDTANAFALDIQRYLTDEPVLAGPPSAAYRLKKFLRRNKGPVLAAAMIVLALVTGVVVSTWQAIRATSAERLARERLAAVETANAQTAQALEETQKAQRETQQALSDSEQARTQAEGVSRFLVDSFRKPDPAQDGRTLTVAELLGQAATELHRNTDLPPLTRAALLNAIGETYIGLGLEPDAVRVLERARSIRRDHLGNEHHDTLTSLRHLARAYQNSGRVTEALPLYEEAVRLHKATLGPDHPDTLWSIGGLSVGYNTAGRGAEAVPMMEEALRLSRAKLGPDDPITLSLMGNIVLRYRDAGRYADALPVAEEAFRRSKTKLGPDHPSTLQRMIHLAIAYGLAGRPSDAVSVHEEALHLSKSKLGPDHPDTITLMNNLASSYVSTGRLADAVPLSEESLRLATATREPDSISTLTAMATLAYVYKAAGRYADALKLYEEVYRRRKARLGPNQVMVLSSLRSLAGAHRDAGQLDEAKKLFNEALRLGMANQGPDHFSTLDASNGLALTYQAGGRNADAIPLFEEVVRVRRAKLQSGHAQTLSSLSNLAQAYETVGRLSDAEQLWRELATLSKAKNGSDSTLYANLLASLGLNLLTQNKPGDAEPLLRECLAIREQKQPDSWSTYYTKSTFGGSLLAEKKFADAEPLLLAGYEGMKQRSDTIPRVSKMRLTEALQRLVDLYTAWERPGEAAKWQKALDAAQPLGGPAELIR